MQLAVLCVSVFALSCFVSATPHGYGVKSGAAAKADASAAAGAFGEIPLVIPTGAGFSGSFTKSSSSSSASSSASSSSSSFTYSGSSFPGVSGGCSTGICQNSGTHDKNSETTNGNQNSNYNHAFPSVGAAGHAGANAGSQLSLGGNINPSCTGSDCYQKGGDCKGPNCERFADGSDCKTGKCGTSAESGIKTTNVNVDKDDTHNNNNCQSGQCKTSPSCLGEQCAHSLTSDNTPSLSQYDHSEDTSKGSASTSSNVANTHSSYNPVQGAPSTSYDSEKCTSGNCKQSSNHEATHPNSDDEDIDVNVAKNSNSKSSYHNNYKENTVGNNKSPPNCAFGNCASNPPLSTSYGTHPHSSYNFDKSKCSSPDCNNDVYNHAAAAGGASGPAYNQPATYLTTPNKGSSCTSPDCKSTNFVPDYRPSGNVPTPGSQSHVPSDIKKPFDCTGGHCANSQPNSYFTPSYANTPVPNSDIGPSGHKCTSPNCATIPQHQSPHNHNVIQSPVPSIVSSAKPLSPTQTAFSPTINNPSNKPLNNASPNQEEPYPSFVPLTPPGSQPCGYNGCPGKLTSKPHYGSNIVPQSNYVQSGSPSSPSISSYPSSAPSIGTSHGIHSLNKPSHKNDKPLYTGGFGGPAGLLKPNDYSLPSTLPLPLPKPAVEQQPSTSCSTSNCNNAPHHGHINNGNANAASPVGSFGGPPGLLKPNDYGLPSSVPISNPITGHHHSVSCSTGNCHNAPSHGHVHNGNANAVSTVGSFGGPSGLLKPNDYSQPSTLPLNNPTGVHHHSVPCSTGNCNDAPNQGQINNGNANAGSAAGSFGGPPGLLKPNDYNLPSTAPLNKPATGHHPSVSCSTGNCNNAPNHGHINNGNANAASAVGNFGGPSGSLKPNDYSQSSTIPQNNPTGTHHHSVPCSTGNCNNAPNHGKINNGNVNAVSAAGSFGGPPGLLKPNDYSLPSTAPLNKPATGHPQFVTCSTGNCNNAHNHGYINTGNANAASAVGSFGGSSGSLKPNDYSQPSTVPLNNPTGAYHHSVPCSTGNCNNAPNNGQINNGNTNAVSAAGSFGGPPGLLKPNDYSLPSTASLHKPAIGHQHPVTCSTGNCNNDHVAINHGNSNTIPATHSTSCATGKCSSPNGSGSQIVNGAHAFAGAAASANAIAYTGGFGGPPGFLKPYDGGNFKSTLVSLHGKSALSNTNLGDNSANGVHSTYNQGVGSVSQAFATAGAGAGSFGGGSGHYNNDEGSGIKTGRGCSGDCAEGDNGAKGSGLKSYLDSGTLGLSAAKAGATSGAHSGSFGYGGSFASSSASAHAHAGAAVKGYGRK